MTIIKTEVGFNSDFTRAILNYLYETHDKLESELKNKTSKQITNLTHKQFEKRLEEKYLPKILKTICEKIQIPIEFSIKNIKLKSKCLGTLCAEIEIEELEHFNKSQRRYFLTCFEYSKLVKKIEDEFMWAIFYLGDEK